MPSYRLISTMKSAQINKYGSSEVIKINENTPEPIISPGKVIVTIKASRRKPSRLENS